MKSKRISFIPQLELSDCGAACLAMAMATHGVHVSVRDLRDIAVSDRGSVDAATLLRAATTLGFKGRGIRVQLEGVKDLSPGSILHWDMNHFVVFERAVRGGIVVVDPARGRRRVAATELSKSFTGVALVIEPDKATPTEGPQQSTSGLLSLLGGHSMLTVRLLAISVVLQVLSLVIPVFVMVTIDEVLPTRDYGYLSWLTFSFLVIAFLSFSGHFIRAHVLLRLRVKMTMGMVSKSSSHLSRLPYSFFLKRSRGDLSSRLQSISVLSDLLATRTIASLIDGILALTYLAILIVVSLQLAAVVLAFVLFQLSILFLWRRPQERLMSETLAADALSQGWLTQVLSGIEILKLSGRAEAALDQWEAYFTRYANTAIQRGGLVNFTDSLLVLTRVLATVLVISISAERTLKGMLSVGIMLGAVVLVERVIGPLANAVSSGLTLAAAPSYLMRLKDVLDHEVETSGNAKPDPLLPLTVSRAEFSYKGSGRLTLVDISFRLSAGSFLAVVGPSGSGKSTLLALLLGMHETTSGSITYGGHNLRDIELDYLRTQIGIVTQVPHLFARSIAENVSMFDTSVPRNDIEEALWLACLESLAESVPGGLDSILAEGGATLSGGERQRLTIARAIVRRPQLLLLDEATSALDPLIESRVIRNLRDTGMTLIVASHRLSIIEKADYVIVLESGNIIESGPPHELLQTRGYLWGMKVGDLPYGSSRENQRRIARDD